MAYATLFYYYMITAFHICLSVISRLLITEPIILLALFTITKTNIYPA